MKALISIFFFLSLLSCKKNKQYDYCKENLCKYNSVQINGKTIVFNNEIFTTLNGKFDFGLERVIHGEYPLKAETISFAGIPDTLGLIYLKKGDAWSGYPVVKYSYFEEDVSIDYSAPYDSTSSWLEIFELDSTHIKGRAKLKLFRSGNDYQSTFYGDVDTLNMSFDFNVFK